MKKLRVSIVVYFLAMIAATSAAADREMRVGYGSGPGHFEDIAVERGLDLTAEQRERIMTLRQVHMKDIRPLQERLYVKSRELKGLWLATTPDRERILPLQKEVQTLRNQLLDRLTTYHLEVRQLLTPEQQAKIRSHGPERRPPRMGGPGMRGDREQGRGMRGPMPPPAGVAPRERLQGPQ
jgi:Spy/CpxP family protein refolding chaperone